MQESEQDQQFVYILRNRAGYPIYVGRGAKSTRPQAHFGGRAHNAELIDAILEGSVTIEITGALGNASTAAIVEAALISALKLTPSIAGKLKNKHPGACAGRFRPYGVPTRFVDRAALPPLCEADLISAAEGRPVIAVLLTKKVLRDGRKAFDMALGASDRDIARQMDRWWPIGREWREHWAANPASSPRLLVGMSGSPRHRVVVGALAVDGDEAIQESSPNNLHRFRISVRYAAGLDFAELRGRSIDVGKVQESGIKIILPE